MKTSAYPRAALAAALMIAATAGSASAAVYTYSDALTASSPAYVREFRSFGDYRYAAFAFNVAQTGNYQITTQAPTYDGFLFLYAGSFDPASPSANLIQFSDDGTDFTNSSLTALLSSGMDYFAVNTTYSVFSSNATAYPNAAGFTTTISGPGVITAVAAVPEPATLAMLLAGLGLMACSVKRRRPTNAQTGSRAGR